MSKSLRGRVIALVGLAVASLLTALPAPLASAATTSISCGGQRPYRVGKPWVCTFDDEFNDGKFDGTKWWTPPTSVTGFHVGAECLVASTNNLSESAGLLSVTVRREAAPFTCTTPTGSYVTQYTSEMLTTNGRFSQAYGRFEIRAKFPAATIAGLQESLWLYPPVGKYGPWPTSGEIDIAEAYSQYPDRVIPYVHYSPATPDPNATNTNCRINPAQFHVYVATWTPTTITVTFDGRTCISDTWNPAAPLTKPAPFDQPFNLIITAGLGVGSNAVTAATPLPAVTQIDYVRIWS